LIEEKGGKIQTTPHPMERDYEEKYKVYRSATRSGGCGTRRISFRNGELSHFGGGEQVKIHHVHAFGRQTGGGESLGSNREELGNCFALIKAEKGRGGKTGEALADPN